MDELEKAYLAGIIDGEGSVTLAKHHRNETPVPRISIANNNLALLQWVKERVGCGVISSKVKRKAHHHDSYAWSICFNKVIDILKQIRKYLIIKRQQADLILNEYKSVTPRNGKYSKKMFKSKMELVAKIRKLNQR